MITIMAARDIQNFRVFNDIIKETSEKFKKIPNLFKGLYLNNEKKNDEDILNA